MSGGRKEEDRQMQERGCNMFAVRNQSKVGSIQNKVFMKPEVIEISNQEY